MAGRSLYLGASPDGWAWAAPDHALLVLGPPRSGKTTSVVIPNVLAAQGPVISTSTKPDVVGATLAHRSRLGRCWVFDPSGEAQVPDHANRLRWSPVTPSADWDTARTMARSLVAATREGTVVSDSSYWRARAQLLLGPLLHAAALDQLSVAAVTRWVNRRDLAPARAILEDRGSELAADVLAGLAAGEERELSHVLSTATTVLQAYQSRAALEGAENPNFDPAAFVVSADTIYIWAPSRSQELVAPLVVALLEEVTSAAYRVAGGQGRPGGPGQPAPAGPLVLALDEVANIAPLPGLPKILSEGGGQGILTLACFQDLSQARARWGAAADGFLSTLGGKLVLPGIGDTRTLEALSVLCGDIDVPVRSTGRSGPWWRPGGISVSTSWSTRRQRRIPVDALSRGVPGQALYLEGGRRPVSVALTPCHLTPPWRELVAGPPLSRPADRTPVPGLGPSRQERRTGRRGSGGEGGVGLGR